MVQLVFAAVIIFAGVPQGLAGSSRVPSSGRSPSELPPEILALDEALESLETQEEFDKGTAEGYPSTGESLDDSYDGFFKNLKTHPRAKRQVIRGPSWRSANYTPPDPPSICPPLSHPPSYYNKWKYLKYIVNQHHPGCMAAGCFKRCPRRHRREACIFDFDTLIMRLTVLETRLKDLVRVETRLKVHTGLVRNIMSNPGYPGEAGDQGDPGPKGQSGFKGSSGGTGTPGICRTTGATSTPQTGPQGPPGPKGNPGPPGDKTCGCDGERGASGPPGEALKGHPGPRGPRGKKGEMGLSREPFK